MFKFGYLSFSSYNTFCFKKLTGLAEFCISCMLSSHFHLSAAQAYYFYHEESFLLYNIGCAVDCSGADLDRVLG